MDTEKSGGPAGSFVGRAGRGSWIAAAAIAVWFLFLLDTEPAWFYFLPVASFFVLLWSLLFVATARWRTAGLMAAATFLTIYVVAWIKFSYVQMTFHVYDIVFHGLSVAQILFFFHMFPKVAWPAAAIVALAAFGLWRIARSEAPSYTRGERWRIALCAALAAGLGSLLLTSHNADFFNARRYALSAFFASFKDLPVLLRFGGLIETKAIARESLPTVAPRLECAPGEKPPHIVLTLNESAMPPGVHANIVHPTEAQSLFVSDGEIKRLRVETFGGASWLSDFSALTGLATRGFGSMRNFAPQFMSGKLRHALPQYLASCGYHGTVVYPDELEFAGAGLFYKSIGFTDIIDKDIHKGDGRDRDAYYYDQAMQAFRRNMASGKPQLVSVATMATHTPWDFRFAPEEAKDLKGDWNKDPQADEYMRRLVLAARDREAFIAQLKKEFPGEKFLLVGYGDHQPAMKAIPLAKAVELSADGRTHELHPDSVAFETYFSVEGVNFTPGSYPRAPIMEIANLPLVTIMAAKLPLNEVWKQRVDLFETCKGLYTTCADRMAIVDFQTWLVGQGWIATN